MPTNIIFVDIDGPLLPGKLHLMKQNRLTGKNNPPVFDNFAVTAFNLWAKYGNAQIVFSTNWACSFADDELKSIMSVNGLEFEYHNECVTPKRFTSQRHTEILDWLGDYAEPGTKFIAVDDDRSCKWIETFLEDEDSNRSDIDVEGKWIEVDFMNGLTYDNFLSGCEALGIDLDDINEKEFGITKEDRKKRQEALDMLKWYV